MKLSLCIGPLKRDIRVVLSASATLMTLCLFMSLDELQNMQELEVDCWLVIMPDVSKK
jgi:hypothetical protein